MTSQHDPFNTKRPRVHRLKPWQRGVCAVAAWGIGLLYRTWRFRLGPESMEALRSTPGPRVMVAWHNRSFAIPEVFRRLFDPERVACLVSPSKAAAWEVELFRRFRLRSIRGSTTRRSIQAAREILRELKAGRDVGISPDGPSGPLYSFKEGAAALARSAGVPILAIIPNARFALRLPTWDRHLIPLPFARVDVELRVVHPVNREGRLPAEALARETRRVCLELTRDPNKHDGHEQTGTR